MPLPVQLTMLMPAVWFADTVDVIVPSVLLELDPAIFMKNPTKSSPDLFTSPLDPTVIPSASKEVKLFEPVVDSEALELDTISLSVPLTASYHWWESVASLFLTQIKSG